MIEITKWLADIKKMDSDAYKHIQRAISVCVVFRFDNMLETMHAVKSKTNIGDLWGNDARNLLKDDVAFQFPYPAFLAITKYEPDDEQIRVIGIIEATPIGSKERRFFMFSRIPFQSGRFAPLAVEFNNLNYEVEIKYNGALPDKKALESEIEFAMNSIFWCAAAINMQPEIRVGAPSASMARKLRKHKLPLKEEKTVILEVPKTTIASEHKGGTHASPRVHLRRGHWRRTKKATIWVKAAVVGEKSKGMIIKDYMVTTNASESMH